MSKRQYFITIGNTSVYVEDLMMTHGMAVGQNGKLIYPGVCQHCGKTNIRYLAHVRQDLSDTMARATGDATEHGAAFELNDETFCKDSAAFCDGKAAKEIEVGCVCVGKYLADCGVDVGLAQRVQEEVTKIMHILQKIAQLEAAKVPSYLSKSVASYETVVVLRERSDALRKVKYWQEPTLKDQEKTNTYYALRNRMYNEYDEAAKRWKRENFGFHTYFMKPGAVTVASLDTHFDNCIAAEQTKLHRYQRGAHYVN